MKERLLSLDTLRGFDMLWIMGFAGVLKAFFAASPTPLSQTLAAQLHHAVGIGFTAYDLIFPLFLFMAGASWPFSYASQVTRGVSSARIHLRIFKRVLVLAALQMVQSGILQFDPELYHYPSVLIRIALSWALAALVYMHCKPRLRAAIAVCGVLAYWAILAFVPSPLLPPNAPFDYGNWQTGHGYWLNRYVSFRAWFGHDPFEVMDIPLSVVQVPLALLGMFAGDVVRRTDWSGVRRAGVLGVLGVGLVVVAAGFVAAGCPLAKVVSTPSFMCLSGGLCCLLFAAFYYLIDVRGFARWTYPLRIIGRNALVAYLAPSIVSFGPLSAFFFGGLARLTPMPDCILAFGALLACWSLLWLLDRAGLYLKA